MALFCNWLRSCCPSQQTRDDSSTETSSAVPFSPRNELDIYLDPYTGVRFGYYDPHVERVYAAGKFKNIPPLEISFTASESKKDISEGPGPEAVVGEIFSRVVEGHEGKTESEVAEPIESEEELEVTEEELEEREEIPEAYEGMTKTTDAS